jgi:hypothetical protein
MSMPGAVRASLLSTVEHCTASLAEGSSEEGDQRAAMDAMIAAALKKLPHLSEETIRKLPQRWP